MAGLTASQWAHFLLRLTIPTLQRLAIDSHCTVTMLLKFLRCHSGINSLRIAPQLNPGSAQPAHSGGKLDLSLNFLSGPAYYLDALLASLSSSSHLHSMSLRADQSVGQMFAQFVETIMSCMTRHMGLKWVVIDIPDEAVDLSTFSIDCIKEFLPSLSHISHLNIVSWSRVGSYPSSFNNEVLVCHSDLISVLLTVCCSGAMCQICSPIPCLETCPFHRDSYL